MSNHKLTKSSGILLSNLLRRERFKVSHERADGQADTWPEMVPAKVTTLVDVATLSGDDLTPGEGEIDLYFIRTPPELTKASTLPVKVKNRLFRKYVVGEWVYVSQDMSGEFWIINGSLSALFLTGGSGIPARTGTGSGPFTPGVASCKRCEYYIDSGTLKIRVCDPEVSESVANSTPTAIGATKLIQTELIDGRWTIDVDPC